MADETSEASGATPHHIEPRTALLIIAGVAVVALVVLIFVLKQDTEMEMEVAPPALSEKDRRAQEVRREFAKTLESTPTMSDEEARATREVFNESMQDTESSTDEEAMAARAEFSQSPQ